MNSLPTNVFPTNSLEELPHQKSRRRFLKEVLAGATFAAIGATAGFPGRVIASTGYVAPSGTSPTQAGTLDVGRLKVATENFAKFTFPERDQTHALFNNTWADPNGTHKAMIAAQWTSARLEAMAAWDWLPWDKTYTHAWHSIYHGLDTAAGVNTDNRFPFPISRYRGLTLDIPNVYVAADGKWALGFDMFLFKSMNGNWWESSNVQAEIFIALKRQGYPIPSELWSMTSGGLTYGCGKWSADSNLYFFSRKDDPAVPFRQQINIYDFVNALKARGATQDSNVLSGVFFGSEPIEGSGTWRIDSFYTTLTA